MESAARVGVNVELTERKPFASGFLVQHPGRFDVRTLAIPRSCAPSKAENDRDNCSDDRSDSGQQWFSVQIAQDFVSISVLDRFADCADKKERSGKAGYPDLPFWLLKLRKL